MSIVHPEESRKSCVDLLAPFCPALVTSTLSCAQLSVVEQVSMRGPIPTSTDCSVALVVSPTVCEVDKKTKATKQSSASTAGSCRASGEQWHERHEWSDRRQQVSSCHAMGKLSTARILPQKPQHMCVQEKRETHPRSHTTDQTHMA